MDNKNVSPSDSVISWMTRLRPCPSVVSNTIISDCSELEGRVREKQTLNTIRTVLAEDKAGDLSHQQSPAAIEDKQKEDEEEASFSDSS